MKKKSKINLIIIITVLLVAIGVSTYAYYNAVITGTSRVNVLTKTASQAVISVGNNDSVTLTVLPEDMYEDNNGTYKESSEEEAGTLYATVSTGSANGQTCSVTIKYEADEDYVFTRSHYCSKDGEANTYGTCAEGYTAHTTSEITDTPEYALYLEPVVSKGYLESDENVNSLVDISDINDDTETTIKTYTWKLPNSDTNGRIDVNVKARYYNLNFDQNSSADKTYTGNISMNVYCVGETDPTQALFTKLHLSTADILDKTPNYTVNPTQETSGILKTVDDYGTSYVFRGGISNNWAKFGKEYVSAICTNEAGTKEIISAVTGDKIKTETECTTTYSYSCSNDDTIFVGNSSGVHPCGTLGLTEVNGNIKGTYHASPVTIEKNMYWRAVRINGDGSLRLVYTGNFIPKVDTIFLGGGYYIRFDKPTFNLVSDNNANVGYMYGNSNGTTYEEVHANINNSTIKTYIDNWYTNRTNLGTTNDLVVADNYFCYDRSLYKGTVWGTNYSAATGIGTIPTAYGAAGRLISETNFSLKNGASPSLICPQANDMFMKNSTTLNNKTTVATGAKIGLLSVDEVVMAGATTVSGPGNYNQKFYLYSAWRTMWLGTPFEYTTYPSVFMLNSIGGLQIRAVYDENQVYVAPVISVDTTYLTTGNGTAPNPWVFEITNS